MKMTLDKSYPQPRGGHSTLESATWVHIPALSWRTVGKLCSLAEPQFLYLYNGDTVPHTS